MGEHFSPNIAEGMPLPVISLMRCVECSEGISDQKVAREQRGYIFHDVVSTSSHSFPECPTILSESWLVRLIRASIQRQRLLKRLNRVPQTNCQNPSRTRDLTLMNDWKRDGNSTSLLERLPIPGWPAHQHAPQLVLGQ